jgi:hypothetical protein
VVYLAAYTVAVEFVGPLRLDHALGDAVYNRVFAAGSPVALLLVAATWSPLILLCAGIAYVPVRRLRRPVSQRARLTLLACLTLALVVASNATLLDGWEGTAISLVFGHDTQYAAGYTALGFFRVQPGMTEAEVVRLIGAPLSRYQDSDGDFTLTWTRSAHKSDYRMRTVQFSSGRVVGKYSDLYID